MNRGKLVAKQKACIKGTAIVEFDERAKEFWWEYQEAHYNENAFWDYVDEKTKKLINDINETAFFGIALYDGKAEVNIRRGKKRKTKKTLDRIAQNVAVAFKKWEQDFLRSKGI